MRKKLTSSSEQSKISQSGGLSVSKKQKKTGSLIFGQLEWVLLEIIRLFYKIQQYSPKSGKNI